MPDMTHEASEEVNAAVLREEVTALRAQLSAANSRLLDMVAGFSPQPNTATVDELITLIENNGAELAVRMSQAEAEVARLRPAAQYAIDKLMAPTTYNDGTRKPRVEQGIINTLHDALKQEPANV